MRKYGWLLSVLWVVGCTEPNPAFDPDPFLPGECREGVEVAETFRTYERPEKLDVLFVVDTTGDVEALQEIVARAMPQFSAVLGETDVDGRIAVTTSAADNRGLVGPITDVEGCEDNDVAVADTNESNWSEAVACNLRVGTAPEEVVDQPIGVIDAQLSEGSGSKFFRSDARLLVVIVTKNDDCSSGEGGGDASVCGDERALIDVVETVEQWRVDRVAEDSIALAVFGGPPSRLAAEQARPVCSSSVGSVLPGNRLYRATRSFGDLGFYFSACTDDVFAPLATVVDRFVDEVTVTLCPGAPLVHEPLSVVAVTEDDQESIPQGGDGFVFLGETPTCEEGALRFTGEAIREAQQVDVEYCTVP